jgi:cysteine desulfurase
MIYLDHAASTPVDKRVVDAMTTALATVCANPSATHTLGRVAQARAGDARAEVAALIGAEAEEIVFTSGATEADNLALFGIMRHAPAAQRHLVTSRIEHPAVLDAARRLEREGCAVSYVPCEANGRVSVVALQAALRPETRLVSLMSVNNETGVIQDLASIAQVCRSRGILVHTDAAQALGHLPIDVRALDVDLMSLSAHKMGGPPGVGALWVGPRAVRQLKPILAGGGQERGLRPGTVPLHQVVGMGAACGLSRHQLDADLRHCRGLTDQLSRRLTALGGVTRNGADELRAAHIVNLAFAGVDGEALHASLGDLAVSGGSACAAEKGEPSYVLRALGLNDAAAEASIRFSVGRDTTESDIENAAILVENAILRLRKLGPK